MSSFREQLVNGLQNLSAWEGAAVLLAIVYLVLAIRENPLCWPAAMISSGIYFVLMSQAGIYMQSALQLFYIAMAIYGWYHWTHGEGPDDRLAITSWQPRQHIIPLLAIGIASAISSYLLSTYTDAAMPYIDSLTTWAAIVTTWMVARKVIQNWHYWFVIDSLSVYLYFNRGLALTALLFMLYLVLVVAGYIRWKKQWNLQQGAAA